MKELAPERERLLETCIRLLDSGTSLDECLERYPDDADELRPYLELRTGLLSERAAEPPTGAYAAGRSRLLEQLAISREEGENRTSPWSLVTGIFTIQRLPGGTVAKAGAGIVAVLALGIGALGASAAGGFEPARDAFEPARDVLQTLRIVPDRDEPKTRDADQRPSEGDSDAVPTAEEAREADRATATPIPCDRRSDRPCEDEPRPSPTPLFDVRPEDEPVSDKAPTPTPIRDEPSRPTDGEPMATPVRDSLPDEPLRDPAMTPISDADAPAREAPHEDTRGGDVQPVAEPTAEPTTEPRPPDQDQPIDGPERFDDFVGDGGQASRR